MAKNPKPATEVTEIADTPVQEPVVKQEPLLSEGLSSQTDTPEEKEEEPLPDMDPAEESTITGEHHTFDQAREEITEYNQEVEKGNIPSDSTGSVDVALEKVKEAKEKTGSQSVLDVLNESNAPTDTTIEDNPDDLDPDEELDEDEESSEPDYKSEASELMAKQYLKEIWRCPVTDYWFSSKIYAEDHQKKTGKNLEHYKA